MGANIQRRLFTKGTVMSEVIDTAVAALSAKLPNGFDGVAKFVLSGEGAIMVDGSGVRAGDEPADVTLTAAAEVFQAMLAGEMNPTMAFMTGKLTVDGNMGLAMQLGAAMA
jgi:putative sterol carrier protein